VALKPLSITLLLTVFLSSDDWYLQFMQFMVDARLAQWGVNYPTWPYSQAGALVLAVAELPSFTSM
jgi:hypothetical protein